MMPEEVHEVIAKILLCVFATFALCFARAKADVAAPDLRMTNSMTLTVVKSL